MHSILASMMKLLRSVGMLVYTCDNGSSAARRAYGALFSSARQCWHVSRRNDNDRPFHYGAFLGFSAVDRRRALAQLHESNFRAENASEFVYIAGGNNQTQRRACVSASLVHSTHDWTELEF